MNFYQMTLTNTRHFQLCSTAMPQHIIIRFLKERSVRLFVDNHSVCLLSLTFYLSYYLSIYLCNYSSIQLILSPPLLLSLSLSVIKARYDEFLQWMPKGVFNKLSICKVLLCLSVSAATSRFGRQQRVVDAFFRRSESVWGGVSDTICTTYGNTAIKLLARGNGEESS